jgi:transportin-1
MPLVLQQIELEPVLDTVSVCNNATWAVGEIALGFGNDRKCFGGDGMLIKAGAIG